MGIDEKDVEKRRPLYELIDKLATEIDAHRVKVRTAAAPLFDKLNVAQCAGDLRETAKIFKRIAAHFEREGLRGDAQTYRLAAAAETARLRRRTWVEKRKGQR